MLWKIYFWILAVVAVSNVIGFVIQGSGLLPLVSSVVCALAAYAYSYNKKIFPQRNWKVWLVIVLIAQSLRWYALVSGQDILTVITLLTFWIIVSVPAWYCMYKLGFGKKERVKTLNTKISKSKSRKR